MCTDSASASLDFTNRHLGMPVLFDPADGQTIFSPPGDGDGYWVGAPSVIYDDHRHKFFLSYRLRKPRGQGRGYECRIAESTDGVSFSDIWSAPSAEFGGISVERGALVITPEGRYRFYLGYVLPEDQKWKIDVVEAETPDKFDPSTKRRVLAPEDCGVEGVKDPYVLLLGGQYYMLVSYSPTPESLAEADRRRLHATADIFATGKSSSNTGLATSSDGLHFTWHGDVLSPGEGWDAYAARITAVLPNPPLFNVFYDGGAEVGRNYEEQTGLAYTFDLRSFHRVTEAGPLLTSPYSSGSLRYLDVLRIGESLYYYYEMALENGSHDLRVSVCRLSE